MFKRGFKSWCENASLQYRTEMSVDAVDPIDAFEFANHLGARLVTPHDLPALSEESKSILLGSQSDAWSAVTLSLNGRYLIIYNPMNAKTRQASDITHELSHIILSHKGQMVHSYELGIFLRQYEKSCEEEANWLAGTLLLPREALIKIAYGKVSESQAAKNYGVSTSLLKWRLNASGVNLMRRRTMAKKY